MVMHKSLCFAAAAVFSFVTNVAIGAQGPIYKCTQADGTLLYSDYPCDGGAVVDVHPGRADPNAKDRLIRAQAELDRAAAERRVNEQEAAARREEMNQLRRQSEAAQSMAEPVSNAADVYYGTGYDGYGSYTPRRMQRSNIHGGGRGHRLSPKDRFHGQGRLPAVIRRPHPPG
ncbi:MAG TPA: hypothetical protein VGL25_01535 [Casimicrobiaceae bacterium]|jgi:hypothetical protein